MGELHRAEFVKPLVQLSPRFEIGRLKRKLTAEYQLQRWLLELAFAGSATITFNEGH